MEVITEIMKASDAGKGQKAKTAEKPGAHGKDPQENELEALLSTASLPVRRHYHRPRRDAEYLCQLHSPCPA